MKIKEFSQKYSVTLFFTTIVLFVILVFVVFSSFSRPGPGSMGGFPQGGFNPPQGQGMPPQGGFQGAPTGGQTQNDNQPTQ
jgi:hypothetical protein